ncbi:MAG: Ig-like domain-containing protein [Bacteroidetes bacterium]|nr:Ig-like domain-containing protein [Bacteroidota bacterium]
MKSKNHFFKRRFQTLVLFAAFTFNVNLQAQIDQQQYAVGSTQSFTSALSQSNKTGDGNGTAILLPVAQGKSLQGTVAMSKNDKNEQIFIGNIAGKKFNTFSLTVKSGEVSGHSILIDEKKAFKYTTVQGQVFVQEVDINTLVCVGYERGKDMPKQAVKTQTFKTEATVDVFNLQSLPGAKYCALLDFNGETVTGISPVSKTIVALPIKGLSDGWILEAWEIVSEDYRPFNINITTSEAVFNSYSLSNRQRCIITETGDAVPLNSGGIAQVGSFGGLRQYPCWVINRENAVQMAETCSHEIGHTFGLDHDGLKTFNAGKLEYYNGTSAWAPIMGYSAGGKVTQWSKGEYLGATNKEDDIAIIASKIGYRLDEDLNVSSINLPLSNSDVVENLNSGVIGSSSDLDVFRFTLTNSGEIDLKISTSGISSNLNLAVDLINQNGIIVKSYSTPSQTNRDIQIREKLGAGYYDLRINGVGFGSASDIASGAGYTDYASLGYYKITGTVNIFPQISITNPSSTKTYNKGAPITIIANPSDVDGVIARVHFYDGATEIGIATKAPYTCAWTATSGTHALKAVVYDYRGGFGVSNVNVTVNNGVMCGVPAWNATTAYKVGAVISYKNYLVTCIAANTNISPGLQQGIAYWKFGNICPGVNQSPKVSITNPVNNSTVFLPSTITAAASDVDGDVIKVEFFRNGVKVGEKTSSPYTIAIPAANGQFSFTAKVTDNEGATSTSQVVTVTLNTPPTVSVTNPVAGKKYNAGAPVTISANAADVDGSILKVDFLIDNVLQSVSLMAPYVFVWKATPGAHVIQAVAYDNNNKSSQSAVVNISVTPSNSCTGGEWSSTRTYYPGDIVAIPYTNTTFVTCLKTNTNINPATQASAGYWQINICPQVNQKPTVSITSPVTNTALIKPATITVTASAYDADGDINKVVFRRDGIVVGEKTSSPYTVTFPAQAGVSLYTAQAFDNEGASTLSAAVSVYADFTDGCSVLPYSALKQYSAGSLVSFNGYIYKANVATINQTPTLFAGMGKIWTLLSACGKMFKTDNSTEISNVEQIVANVFSLYPNPSTGIVTVKLQEQSNVTLKVLNVTGAEVAQRTYTATTLINEEMNLSHLSSGLYFVHVLVNDQLKVEKLVIE